MGSNCPRRACFVRPETHDAPRSEDTRFSKPATPTRAGSHNPNGPKADHALNSETDQPTQIKTALRTTWRKSQLGAVFQLRIQPRLIRFGGCVIDPRTRAVIDEPQCAT